jgi:7,8-dihydropterin-6-yl-methyl-4-(beta-D-ribofuranosyl)aminobenzene 5'-phosphate synthase
MQVTLVVDNLAQGELRSEHGLSILVETSQGSVLFDTGQSDAWLGNMIALGKDPEAIRAIAVSHGHYDHTGGIAAALIRLPQVNVFGHLDCLRPRYAVDGDRRRAIGIPDEALVFQPRFMFNERSKQILPGVTLSGEIPIRRSVDTGPFFMEDEPDTFADEQCMILREGGYVGVLLGCSHRGVENNILAAMDVAGTAGLDLVIGGMHLGGADQSRLEAIASFLEAEDIGRIVPCHCTGDRAFEYLRDRLGERVVQKRAGMHWSLGS